MNNENQSPLVPQGSLLEQKNQGRARVKIAVSIVLAVHGVGLVGLLISGCQKEKEPAAPPAPQEQASTAPAPQLETPTNTPPAPAPDTNPVTPSSVAPVTPAVPPAVPTAPAAAAHDYKIVAGDNFSTLAKNNHVTVKALMDANPGVDPTKLQINQVIHIPAAPAPTTATVAPGTTAPELTNGQKLYDVKSGDTLSTIAKSQGTTIRALRAANNLTTDRIIVGQKLKIPAKASPPPAAPTTPPTQ
jgi:LysM repeat protein